MGRGSRSWTRPSPRAISARIRSAGGCGSSSSGIARPKSSGISAASRHNSIIMPSQPFIYPAAGAAPGVARSRSSRTPIGDADGHGRRAARASSRRSTPTCPSIASSPPQELFDDTIEAAWRSLLTGIAVSVGLVGLTMALIGLYAIVVVSGEPPHPRDRHSHGDRRDAGRGAPDGAPARGDDGRHRRRDRHGRSALRAPEASTAGRSDAPLFDPLLLAAVPMALLATTLAASLIPARRAASIDPQAALRQD